MRIHIISALCVASLLDGCCVAPTEQVAGQVVAPSPSEAAAELASPGGAATAGEVASAASGEGGALVTSAETVASAAGAAAVDGSKVAGTSGESPVDSGAVADKGVAPSGAALAGPAQGTRYAYQDVGISMLVPEGWTQQLMAGGIVALFSPDFSGAGVRDRGALMLISKQPEKLPNDKAEMEKLLKAGIDPAAVVEAGPILLPIGGNEAAQIIAKGSDEDGSSYAAMHTIIQSGANAVSVKAMAFDSLAKRKVVFDGVMESIDFTSG